VFCIPFNDVLSGTISIVTVLVVDVTEDVEIIEELDELFLDQPIDGSDQVDELPRVSAVEITDDLMDGHFFGYVE